jgi:DNA-binding CsgD family transcriptional regulator
MLSWAIPRRVGAVEKYAHHVRALDALTRGDYQSAYRSAREVTPPGQFLPGVGQGLWAAMDLVMAAAHAGRTDAAQAHVTAMRESDLALLSPRLALVVAGSEAIAASELDTALFDRALAVPGALRWPFDLARIQLVYGQRLRRTRAAAQARPHLFAARDTFARLGATPWHRRADQELQATSPVKHGHDARRELTAQEQRVASMAAQGLTNRQIAEQLLISHRTVGAHLHQVFSKLGLTNRAGLHRELSGVTAAALMEAL